MMINLIESLIQSIDLMKGVFQRAQWSTTEVTPRTKYAVVSDYLPAGSLRSIRLSNRS
jgi:hypothetical protein